MNVTQTRSVSYPYYYNMLKSNKYQYLIFKMLGIVSVKVKFGYIDIAGFV